MENNTFDPRVSMLGHALIRASDDMLHNALTVVDGIEPGEGSSKMLLAVRLVRSTWVRKPLSSLVCLVMHSRTQFYNSVCKT